MKKKLLAILLSLCMVLSMLPTMVFASGYDGTSVTKANVDENQNDSYSDDTSLYSNFTVTPADKTADTGYIEVALSAESMTFHANGDGTEGAWMGVNILAPEGASHMQVRWSADPKAEFYSVEEIETLYSGNPSIGSGFTSSKDAATVSEWYLSLKWYSNESTPMEGEEYNYHLTFSVDEFVAVDEAGLQAAVAADVDVTLGSNVTLTSALEIPAGMTLTIADDVTLTLGGNTLTNNGAIAIEDTATTNDIIAAITNSTIGNYISGLIGAGTLKNYGTVTTQYVTGVAGLVMNGGTIESYADSTMEIKVVDPEDTNESGMIIGETGLNITDGYVTISLNTESPATTTNPGYDITLNGDATIAGDFQDADNDGYRIAGKDVFTVASGSTLTIDYRTEVSGDLVVASGASVIINEDAELYVFTATSYNGEVKNEGTITNYGTITEAGSGTTSGAGYIVNFDANGGTATEAAVVAYGLMTTIPSATYSGYTFNGWYDAEDTLLTSDLDISSGNSFTASWTKNSSSSNTGTIIDPDASTTTTTTTDDDTTEAEDVTDETTDVEETTEAEDTTEATLTAQESANLEATGYTDVAEDDWHAEAVQYVVESGLFQGTSSTGFSPETPMSREMTWVVLARLNGMEMSGATAYADAKAWALENGISDGTYPSDAVSREQLVTLLWRNAGSPEAEGDLSAYDDAGDISDYAQAAMAWAIENGIISGMDATTLNPTGEATRAHVAQIMMNLG